MFLVEQQLIHIIDIFKNLKFQKKFQDGQLFKLKT